MCELGVFPISFFFKERSFKSQQNPRVDFFKSRKDFEGLKTLLLVVFFFFHLSQLIFFSNAMFTTPVYNSRRRGRFVNSAFLTRDVLPKKRSFFYDKQN